MAGSGRYHGAERVKPADSMSNDTSAYTYKVKEMFRKPAAFKKKKLAIEGIDVNKNALDHLADDINDKYAQITLAEFYQNGILLIEIKNKRYIALRRVKKAGGSRYIEVLELKNKRKKTYDYVQFRVTLASKTLEQEGPDSADVLEEENDSLDVSEEYPDHSDDLEQLLEIDD